MNGILHDYIRRIKELAPKIEADAIDYYISGLEVSDLPAKHFYIQANMIQKEIGYVHSGLLRAFFIDEKGNEKTVNFAKEGQYASHYTNFASEKPSKFYFQCLEPSLIINIPYQHIQDCCDQFPAFERYIRLVVEDAHSSLLSRMEGFLFGNAESRYLDFIESNQGLFNRIPLFYLCSYLGVERQSLTRIRQKLAHK